MDKVLQIIDLEKIYGREVKTNALSGINLEVKNGEFIAVMGPSGGGKTTLLNMIAGLDKPTKGRILIDGTDITRLSDRKLTSLRREKIGFVFQFFNLLPTLTASENIEISMMIAKKSELEQRKRAIELLELMDILHKKDSKPNDISGGEQQRVAVARALANNPKLILMDEPTGNLDTQNSQELMKYIQNLNNNGKTIIIATHDYNISKYANKIIHIEDGKIKSADEKHEKSFKNSM